MGVACRGQCDVRSKASDYHVRRCREEAPRESVLRHAEVVAKEVFHCRLDADWSVPHWCDRYAELFRVDHEEGFPQYFIHYRKRHKQEYYSGDLDVEKALVQKGEASEDTFRYYPRAVLSLRLRAVLQAQV